MQVEEGWLGGMRDVSIRSRACGVLRAQSIGLVRGPDWVSELMTST